MLVALLMMKAWTSSISVEVTLVQAKGDTLHQVKVVASSEGCIFQRPVQLGKGPLPRDAAVSHDGKSLAFVIGELVHIIRPGEDPLSFPAENGVRWIGWSGTNTLEWVPGRSDPGDHLREDQGELHRVSASKKVEVEVGAINANHRSQRYKQASLSGVYRHVEDANFQRPLGDHGGLWLPPFPGLVGIAGVSPSGSVAVVPAMRGEVGGYAIVWPHKRVTFVEDGITDERLFVGDHAVVVQHSDDAGKRWSDVYVEDFEGRACRIQDAILATTAEYR